MTKVKLSPFLFDGPNATYDLTALKRHLTEPTIADYQQRQWLVHRNTDTFLCDECGELHDFIHLGNSYYKRCLHDPTALLTKVNAAGLYEYRINWYAVGSTLSDVHKLVPILATTPHGLTIGHNTKFVFSLTYATSEQDMQAHIDQLYENFASHKPIIIYSGLVSLSSAFISRLTHLKGKLITVDKAFSKIKNKKSKKSASTEAESSLLPAKPTIILDVPNQILVFGSRSTSLTNQERELARILWEANGDVVQSQLLPEAINMNKVVHQLRVKLSKITKGLKKPKELIKNRYGVGYFLNTQDYTFKIQL